MELPEKGLCHVGLFYKNFIKIHAREVRKRELLRKERKKKTKHRIREEFNKATQFDNSSKNSRRIIAILRDNSLQWEVGC